MAEIDWKEARRYLGLHRGGGTVDEVLEAGLRDCGRALMACARPRSVWRRFPLALGEGRVETAGLQVESLHLRRHLEGCTAVASLRPHWDRRWTRLLPPRLGHRREPGGHDPGLRRLPAGGLLRRVLRRHRGPDGRRRAHPPPPVQPGYGDFPISCQRALLRALEAPKRIGLTATETMMLTPTKSVTALVGLSPEAAPCRPDGCRACGKADCAFRLE